MLLLMAADPMLKVNAGPSLKLAVENFFFYQDTSWRELGWKGFYTLCDFCKDKLGREKAQQKYFKAQAHLFETQKAVEYVTQYAQAWFSKIPFPLEKEALHKTEAICVGSLGLIMVQKILINLRDFYIVPR